MLNGLNLSIKEPYVIILALFFSLIPVLGEYFIVVRKNNAILVMIGKFFIQFCHLYRYAEAERAAPFNGGVTQ